MTNDTPLVLIVDDDAPIRELLSRWLTAAGYETLQAPDAETALPIMMSGVADVVLCDVTCLDAAVSGWSSARVRRVRPWRWCSRPAWRPCIRRSAWLETSWSI